MEKITPYDHVPEEKKCKFIKEDGTKCRAPGMEELDYERCYFHSERQERESLRQSEKVPYMSCISCYLKEECPFFKEDSTCALIQIGDLSDVDTRMKLTRKLLKLEIEMYARQILQEKITGKFSDLPSKRFERIMKAMATIDRLERNPHTEKVRITLTALDFTENISNIIMAPNTQSFVFVGYPSCINIRWKYSRMRVIHNPLIRIPSLRENEFWQMTRQTFIKFHYGSQFISPPVVFISRQAPAVAIT